MMMRQRMFRAALALGAMSLACIPTWAQPPPEKPPVERRIEREVEERVGGARREALEQDRRAHDRALQLEKAREEFELREIQLARKKIELQAAQPLVAEHQERVMSDQRSGSVISNEEKRLHKLQVEQAKAQVEVKGTEVREAEVLLKYARLRLARLERPEDRPRVPTPRPPSGREIRPAGEGGPRSVVPPGHPQEVALLQERLNRIEKQLEKVMEAMESLHRSKSDTTDKLQDVIKQKDQALLQKQLSVLHDELARSRTEGEHLRKELDSLKRERQPRPAKDK